MDRIDEQFVVRTDAELVARGVNLHARPFQVAIAWMKEQNIAGDVLDERLWGPLMDVYRQIYPSGDFSMPALITAGVAIRDQMYTVKIPIGFGQFRVDPLKYIEISREELESVFKHLPEQGWRAFYGVCDVWDFGYGVADLQSVSKSNAALLTNACSSLAATPRILSGAINIDAAVQTACLTAELAMKGVLAHLGTSAGELKHMSHRLPALANAVIKQKSAATDERLRNAVSKFPNYVGTRYSSHGLTRGQLMELAMRAQYVAADVIRRVTERNLGGDMEARADCPDRADI